MSVKIGSLWKKPQFQSLNDTSKLLYLYLAANPGLSTLGVCCLNIDVVSIELDKTIEELREAAIILIDIGYILTSNTKQGVYFCVIDHYMTLPKSENIVAKAQQEMAKLPVQMVGKLSEMVDVNKKFITFKEPSEQEVMDFAASKGFIINAKEFISFYRDTAERLGKSSGWFDSKGKQVKNWQGKLKSVWFKNATPIKECTDAPEGFGFFYAELNGSPIFPDYWKDGKPISKEGLISTKKLQEEYARKGSS